MTHGPHGPMHKIIRLKRYEQPPEGYFDGFLEEFRRRRELEANVQPSFFERLRERIDLYLETFHAPSMAFAGAAAVALVACLVIFRETSRPTPAKVYEISYSAPVTIQGMQPVFWRPGQQSASPLFPSPSVPVGPVRQDVSNSAPTGF